MPSNTDHEFDTDLVRAPYRANQLSANGQWVFGSIYAGLALVGFAFGVWAGAARPKPVEVVEAKPPETDKPAPKVVTPPPTNPNPPPVVEPKKEPGPKIIVPEPKPKEPEPKPKPKEPAPKPKPKEPEPKKPVRVVLFKEVQPLFRAYCNDCHGGSTGKPKGGVDLTTLAKMLNSKGPPLVPGSPDDSTLYTSVKGGDMPPDGKKGPDARELELIRDWIAGGAKERRRTVRVRRRAADRRKVELTPGARSG